MLPLIFGWTNSWTNNRDPDNLRRHSGHYDLTVMGLGGSRHWGCWLFMVRTQTCYDKKTVRHSSLEFYSWLSSSDVYMRQWTLSSLVHVMICLILSWKIWKKLNVIIGKVNRTKQPKQHRSSWWCHQMETFSALLAGPRSPHKGQWRGALMFSLICDWINGWVNNREAGDLDTIAPIMTSP